MRARTRWGRLARGSGVVGCRAGGRQNLGSGTWSQVPDDVTKHPSKALCAARRLRRSRDQPCAAAPRRPVLHAAALGDARERGGRRGGRDATLSEALFRPTTTTGACPLPLLAGAPERRAGVAPGGGASHRRSCTEAVVRKK